MESSVVHMSSPLPPPPSILKVKQPPPLSDEGESGEGGGVGEGEGKSTPATTTRKIRYCYMLLSTRCRDDVIVQVCSGRFTYCFPDIINIGTKVRGE